MTGTASDPAARIGALVEALSSPTVPDAARRRAQALLAATLDLHEEALERLLAVVRDHVADPASLDDALAGDPVASAVLALHGLHPWPPARRIEAEARRLAPGCAVAVAVETGVATVRLHGPAAAAARDAVRAAALDAAPDVDDVVVVAEAPVEIRSRP